MRHPRLVAHDADPRDGTVWVAGSPCSGKSTVAAAIASASGMRLYSADERFDAHLDALVADGAPTATKIASMSLGARLAQPVEVQVADVVRLHVELFPSVLADLSTSTGERVAEGAVLMPELLVEAGVLSEQVVVLVPTPAFQLEHYRRRRWARDLVAGTDDPSSSFDTWMQRDIAYAELITAQARAYGLRIVVNDGTRSVDGLVATVSTMLSPR